MESSSKGGGIIKRIIRNVENSEIRTRNVDGNRANAPIQKPGRETRINIGVVWVG